MKYLPSTLTLQFFPIAADVAFQPCIGAGNNYTSFLDESVDHELESVLDSSKLDLDIETDATFTFCSGMRAATNVDIDPRVYALTLGYKF